MRWSLPPSRYYAEDRLTVGEPSWKTLRSLVSTWVKIHSIFIARIATAKPFIVKVHQTKANRIPSNMPGHDYRNGSLRRLSFYGAKVNRAWAYSKTDIATICPPIR